MWTHHLRLCFPMLYVRVKDLSFRVSWWMEAGYGGNRAKGEAGKVRALNCSRVLIGQKQQLLSPGKKPVEVG